MLEPVGRRRGGEPERHQVDSGVAILEPDADRPRAFTLYIDGTPQSHVDLDDPRYLDFEYVQRIGIAVDECFPTGEAVRALHLGGGALTLPRYVGVTRPGSTQRAVEIDAALAELVRRELPWSSALRLRVRVGDARAAVKGAHDQAYDLVVSDVYAGGQMPASLTSREFLVDVARILRPGGRFVANVADGAPLAFARAQLATARAVFPEVVLLADPAVLRGRRFGNLVLAASAVPLPTAALARRAAGTGFPARVVHDEDLERFVAGARVITDASAVASTAPPGELFGPRSKRAAD